MSKLNVSYPFIFSTVAKKSCLLQKKTSLTVQRGSSTRTNTYVHHTLPYVPYASVPNQELTLYQIQSTARSISLISPAI